jgi:hypothetical protein
MNVYNPTLNKMVSRNNWRDQMKQIPAVWREANKDWEQQNREYEQTSRVIWG